jgi:hypothetical protein
MSIPTKECPIIPAETRISLVAAIAAFATMVVACSGGSGNVKEPDDAGTEAGSDEAGLAGQLTGTVTDRALSPILGARIEAAGAFVFSDAHGKYALSGLSTGPVAVKVSQNWFQPLEQVVVIDGVAPTPFDVIIDEMPLKVDPADRALAAAYNQTFNWTTQKLSLGIVETPTRRAFDNIVYFHNPALYRDTSGQVPVTPSPQPEIGANGAANFTFPVSSGANQGLEALDLVTIVDSIKDTPLGPTEPADFMMWSSMVNWLNEWSPSKSVTLKLAGLAVRQQGWGSNVIRPQEIEKVFLDTVTRKLWVKVVFENFVQLGPGISDDDGDGRKEIYAAVAAAHYTSEILDVLTNTYMKATFTTYGLSQQVTKSLNELYSTTGAQLERYIGQPFDVTGLGTIVYPFVVLKHLAGQENVILVAAGP